MKVIALKLIKNKAFRLAVAGMVLAGAAALGYNVDAATILSIIP